MADLTMRTDKRPGSPIAGGYGHPIHPILVVVPIGAWLASLVFDIASRVVDEGGRGYREGAELLVAIGIIGAVLAAFWGLLDFVRIPKRTTAHRVGLTHLILNDVVLVAFVVSFIWRRNVDDDQTPVGLIVLSVAALLVLGVSGWLGGKLAYRYGVRVADETTQAEGFGTARPAS